MHISIRGSINRANKMQVFITTAKKALPKAPASSDLIKKVHNPRVRTFSSKGDLVNEKEGEKPNWFEKPAQGNGSMKAE